MFLLFKKAYVAALKKIDIGSAIAVRLTKYTGKSKEFIHPKHFLEKTPWFVNYIKKGDLVLDLGSGNGQNSIKASRIAKNVIGIEIDDDLIKIAKNTVKDRRAQNVRFISGDLEGKIPFRNNSFNKIIFLDVLEHLKKRDEVLSEVCRVLKPRGLLFVGVPNKDTSWKKMQRDVGMCSFSDPDHKIEFSEKSIRQLLLRHKFKIINFSYGKYDTPLRGFFDVIGGFSIPIYKKISKWRQQKSKRQPFEASGFEIVTQKK